MKIVHLYLIIVYAITLHTTWGLVFLLDPNAAHATAASILISIPWPQAFAGSVFVAAIFCLLVAVISCIGLLYRSRWRVIFLLPQQFLLMLGAGAAIHSMLIGQFADGVQRTPGFLVVDQAPAVIAAALHTVAIIAIAANLSVPIQSR